MPSLHDLLSEGAARLPSDDARREATLLLCHVLGVGDAWLVAHAGDPADTRAVTAFRALVARRARGEPVAYLTRTRGFHAIELQVTPDVLIPRADTELLVDLALQRIPADGECAVADLGTGSGAIALAIAKARPHAHLLATDASEAALRVARGNAGRLGLHNVEFARGDWYAALGGARFDLIVSNPPYVAEGDPHVAQGDLRFEPRAALVAGSDGLDAIRVLVGGGARAHLRDSGWLLFEHGLEQGAAARGLLQAQCFRGVFTARDLEGRDRVSGGHT